MTGPEAIAALEGIGARLALRPDGLIDVVGPDRPELDPLLDELRQHRDEAIALLLSRPAAPRLPGREPERPCLGCLRVECREGELFHDEACFARWRAERDERRRRGGPQGPASSSVVSLVPASRDVSAPRGTE
jgi:hypothetical protein